MNSFYISVMFIGVIITAFALFLIVTDKGKAIKEMNIMAEKKDELIKIINDAEEMVVELNKFSDYIVSSIDDSCKKAEETIQKLKAFSENTIKPKENDSNEFEQEKKEILTGLKNASTEDKPENLELNLKLNYNNSKTEKILRLFDQGMNAEEIAKDLKIGKGEVLLVLGLNNKKK